MAAMELQLDDLKRQRNENEQQAQKVQSKNEKLAGELDVR